MDALVDSYSLEDERNYGWGNRTHSKMNGIMVSAWMLWYNRSHSKMKVIFVVSGSEFVVSGSGKSVLKRCGKHRHMRKRERAREKERQGKWRDKEIRERERERKRWGKRERERMKRVE